jgi:hypothetical protein
MTPGLLTSATLSFKDLSKDDYARYPQADLTAINLRMSDGTMVRFDDWQSWQKNTPGLAKVLATSGNVPSGFSVAMKKDLTPEVSTQIGKMVCHVGTIVRHETGATARRFIALQVHHRIGHVHTDQSSGCNRG